MCHATTLACLAWILHRRGLIVGQLDQFAKLTFEEETEIVTQGAVSFQVPAETAMYQIRGDGLLLTRAPERMGSLAYPWPEAGPHDEVFVEVKMPGDHLGPLAIQRALLRRQARQVQRLEATRPRWLGEEPLWVVAPRVPAVLVKMRTVQRSGRGCYRIGSDFPFLWIAANELPLQEELIPFLIARSGRSMLHFLQWVAPRRPTTCSSECYSTFPCPRPSMKSCCATSLEPRIRK